MCEQSPEETHGPSPSEVQRMAQACARFEEAWRRGERPDLEKSLAEAGSNADQLLERLLSLDLTFRAHAGEEPKPEEYISRFPASRGLVEAAFAELSTAGGASLKAPLKAVSSRNLLIGVLALQNGFIDHASLIAAIQAWAADKSRRLGEILLRAGKLNARQIELLEALAEEHRRRFGDDVHKSLAAFGSLAPVLRAVEGMGDPDVEASLTTPLTSGDTDVTTAHDAPGADAGENRAGSGGARGKSWSSSRFRILRFHDAGMLGRIFIALDQELNRNVALKEIQEKHAYHPVSRDQFVLEGMVTGALEHPGIVPVYSLGTHEDGSPFYAMRFIQGPSLREKLKQLHGAADAPPLKPGDPPVTLPRLLRHFISACQAMAYAHSRGVLHRDLKPDHILLGPFGETLVVDWGLAMPIARKEGDPAVGDDSIHPPPGGYDSTLAQDGVVVGTVAYMSPEQAAGFISRMDQASDVYALGAILYAILTGKAPFSGGDFATMLGRVRRGDFARPREVNRDVSPALEAVCLKAMSHTPADRYTTAADLAQDVERWLDDEPTIAFSEPLWSRAGRWLRQHRTAAAMAAVALFSTLVALAALNVQAVRANAAIRKERDEADWARAQAVAARGLADDARLQAETNYRDSIGVVQNLLMPVAARDLPNVEGTTRLRRRVASQTADFLAKLQLQRPNDPELRYIAAQTSRELANIKRFLGEPIGETYQQAIDMLRGAIAVRGDDPRYTDRLVETLQDLAATLQNVGKPLEAEPHLREALDLTTDLRKRFPKESAYQRTEARVSNNLANQRLLAGDFPEAARLADVAVQIMKGFADSEMPGPTDRLEVVMYEDTVAEALLGHMKPAEAAKFLDDAIRRADALIVIRAGTNDVHFLKAAALLKQAQAFQRIGGRSDDARKSADAAVGELERLIKVSPSVHYPEVLAETLLTRAAVHLDADRIPDARGDLDRAVELSSGLLNKDRARPAYSALAGRALGRRGLIDVAAGDPAAARGRLGRALELLAVAFKSNPDEPVNRKAQDDFQAALKTLPYPAN